MDRPQTERIHGQRFALWKDVREPRTEAALPGWPLALSILAGTAWIYFGTKHALAMLLKGAPFASWAIVGTVFGPMVFALLFALVQYRRPELPAKGPEVPEEAFPVRVSIAAGDHPLGTTEGWMWIEGGWLRFQGCRFDFQLQRIDFEYRRSLGKRIFRLTSWPVRAGASLPRQIIGWQYLERAKFRRHHQAANSVMDRWDEARPGDESTFPPLRPSPSYLAPRGTIVPAIAGAAAIALSFMTILGLIVTPATKAGSGYGFLFPSIAIAVVAFLLLISPFRSAKRWNRKVDRLLRA